MKASDHLESVWNRWQLRACLGKMVKPGMVALDIGSGGGLSLAILAERVGRAGHVHAFERDAAQFEALQRRFSDERFPQIRLQPVALLHCQRAEVALPPPHDHFLPAHERRQSVCPNMNGVGLASTWKWVERGVFLFVARRSIQVAGVSGWQL